LPFQTNFGINKRGVRPLRFQRVRASIERHPVTERKSAVRPTLNKLAKQHGTRFVVKLSRNTIVAKPSENDIVNGCGVGYVITDSGKEYVP
jgi:hypothetical protein